MQKEIQSFYSFHACRFLHPILQEKGLIAHWLNRMSREYKHIGLKTKMQKQHLLMLLVFAVFLMTWGTGGAMAQEKAPLAEWAGERHGDFTLSSDIDLTGTIYLDGDLTITAPSGKHPTIKRASGKTFGVFFKTEGHKLKIIGHAGDTVFIDGGMTYTKVKFFNSGDTYNTDFDTYGPFKDPSFPNNTSDGASGNVIWINDGGLELDYVCIQNAATNDGTVYVNNTLANQTFKITNTSIRYCYSRASTGSVFSFNSSPYNNALLKNVKIKYCKGSNCGGTIRSHGSTETNLTLDNCEMGYNWVPRYGGAITWFATGRPEAAITLEGNCKLHHNVALNNGGAIYASSNITITSAEIYGNRALGSHFTVEDGLYSTGCGGGIFLYPYTGPATTCVGTPLTCHLSSSVSIHDNYAHDRGGGVYLDLVASNFTGFYKAGDAISDAGNQYYFTICDVDIQGPVYGNEAAQGGGVCIMDFLPDRHYNTSSGKWSKMFLRVINLSGAIYNNKATAQSIDAHHNTYSDYYGGGVYIYKGPRLKLKTNNSSTNSPHVIGPEWEDGGVIGAGYNYKHDYEKSDGAGTCTITINGEVYGNSAKSSSNGFGGGICIVDGFPSNIRSTCNVKVNGSAEVYRNECDNCGGGIYLSGGQFTMTGGIIGKAPTSGTSNGNKASADGGGFYITGGTCTVSGGTIAYNEATRDGGGFYVNPGSGTTTYINSSTATTNINNNKAHDGAGAYVASGNLAITMPNTSIHDNEASDDGGGLFVNQTGNDRTVIYSGAKIKDNKAQEDGGGLYVKRGRVDINENLNNLCDFETGDLSQLMWTNDVTYPWTVTSSSSSSGTYSMKSGNYHVTFNGIAGYVGGGGWNNPHTNSTISTSAYFEQAGTISFNARVSSEGGSDYGYFYIDDVVQSNFNGVSGNNTWAGTGLLTYNISAGYHTFKWKYDKDWRVDSNDDNFYVDNIQLTFTASTPVEITGNQALIGAGGGLYAADGNVNATRANISGNEAATDGGGIYAAGGTVNVHDGTINNNFAAEKGGGLYIPSTGMLNLTGTTTLAGNHVPYGKLGGGVYLLGTVQAGNSSSDAINVSTNYAGNSYVYVQDGANTRNNIYLPNPTDTPTTPDSWPTVITVVNNGLDLNNSSIGFSVPHNFVPVIYCQTASYLSPTLINSNVIFEDSDRYTQKYYADNQSAGYYPNFIYLSADTWVQAVTSQPATGFSVDGSGNVTISTKEGLAWLISYVNGLNSVEGGAHDMSGKTVTLTADVDMKAHIWVPIGMNASDAPKTFKGTFNGNGHTISNICCSYLGDLLVGGTGRGLGMFGITDGATIHDVFLHGVELDVHGQTGSDAYVMGSIANEAKGSTSIYNCIADATMVSTMANTTMGGLVGKLTSGTIHSTAAMPNMTGYQMGGIVGEMTSGGNLYNSFANALFTAQSGSNKYMGGLVGVNAGRIENCYSRLQNTSNPSDTYFGWIAGQNNSGTITYCYIPVNNYGATYVKNGTAADNKCTTYGPTSIPYLYKHADNQMTTNSNNDNIVNGALDRNGLKGLLATLNKWVGNSNTYSKWMRTCASPINDDYPIHNYSNYVCVGSKDNILLEYDADFNAKFGEYISADLGTIYLYKSPLADVTSSLSNSGKATELYIHEDVVMMHTSAIKAHVGITIDNTAGTGGANPSFHINPPDAIDWHFFSSALADAPIGLVYGDQDLYEAYHYPTWQANFTASNAVNGYFPITDFSNNNYYFDWDLYAYHEPDYHWINLKRNSASHWHEDYPDTHIYPYTNDTEFVPGRGYMVALKDEGYLQGYGTLNTNSGENDDFLYFPVTYTPAIAWTTREGHNLLGNPYQSYLDFNEFARDEQNATLWNAGRTPFYIIIDEDKQDYVIYTVRQSKNTEQASRYLHPHQGFMIDVDKNGSARFCNAMRTTTLEGSWTGDFRDDSQPDYPLVNLMATDGYGNRDIVTVELGRPDKGGALKQDAWRTGKGSLWCRYEDEDYALVFTQPGLEYANIRFSCDEDGEYTMTWNTQNGEFSYLHLIDNITGTDIDCLSKIEYKFTAQASDYNSRFRLMFDYTGIEENGEDGPSTGSGTDTAFAFIMNGELVVNGTGLMQLIDLNGRMLTNYNINDAQSTVALPDIPAGLYVLRLITENGTRTQKIVLE